MDSVSVTGISSAAGSASRDDRNEKEKKKIEIIRMESVRDFNTNATEDVLGSARRIVGSVRMLSKIILTVRHATGHLAGHSSPQTSFHVIRS